MAISDRRKIAAVLVLAAGGIGLVGVSSGATFSSTVTGSFTVQADFPPTPTATATASATAEPTPGKSDDPKETESPSPTGSASASPTPTSTLTPSKTAKLTVDTDDHSNWSTDAAPAFTYKKEIAFTGVTAKKIGVFTAQNTGDADLKVTADVTLPTALVGKVTAEVKMVPVQAVLKAAANHKGDTVEYQLWLTPRTSGYTISKDDAKKITLTFAYTAV
ncbi:hypothetical protein [Streptomyces adustus]|uniref:hypothetical protein n=1 Tax=Streptomyces adustus TaxID=1609272 RepID=UPI00372076B3